MLSKRPYLVRALYDWTVDQGHVPILVVDATVSGVKVPIDFVENGQIHLNIGPNAVRHFSMDRAGVGFEARFAGKPEMIFVPMRAVLGIYDRDEGSGAQFPPEPDEEFFDDELPAASNLSLANKTPSEKREGKPGGKPAKPGAPTGEEDEPPTPPRGRAGLRIVK
ncbi:stringent starvation protein B [Halothiobacillus sp. DCM-1]|uniref:stringent starvation protein B n=1 Tax=Halothiobacillus sp. DCM-1 TaxID=3112558 RepID=UPI0032558140